MMIMKVLCFSFLGVISPGSLWATEEFPSEINEADFWSMMKVSSENETTYDEEIRQAYQQILDEDYDVETTSPSSLSRILENESKSGQGEIKSTPLEDVRDPSIEGGDLEVLEPQGLSQI